MEKFYIVSQNCDTYKRYMEYLKYLDAIIEVFSKFADEYGIHSSEFYTYADRLRIMPDDDDEKKFGQYMSKTDYGLFKKNTQMSKEWVSRCKSAGLTTMTKPYVPFIFNVFGKCRYRLFHIGETLYCTYESAEKFDNPNGFNEVKASDFYKMMEENNVEL